MLAVATLSACTPAPPAPPADAIAGLMGRCVTAMVNSTCRVMQNSGQSLVPEGVQTVFVAGVGAIDAKLYNTLRASGEAMCENVRKACEHDWQGSACKTAQALYPADGKK